MVTVSGNGQLLRSWDVSSGALKYEAQTTLPPSTEQGEMTLYPLTETWRPGRVVATLAGKNKGEE